jgi:hypothetical protein
LPDTCAQRDTAGYKVNKRTQIGIANFYEIYNRNNALFDPKSYAHGENLEFPGVLLKETMNKHNMDLDTLDIHPIDNYKEIIFIDLPTKNTIPHGLSLFDLKNMGKRLYLVMCESRQTKPENFNKENHKYFDKVFTWYDPYVDGAKYIKFFLPNKIPINFQIDRGLDRKFCTMIAGNHTSSNPNELYTERRKAIRWFEKNHPGDFDLYGRGWDSEIFRSPSAGIPIKLFCLFKPLRIKFDKDYYPSYKGEVKSKSDIFSKYKFSVCYENAKNISGYISEKIFDSLFAGTIPIYWGAPNITDYIPSNVFIDMRSFDSYEKLYAFLKNMKHNEYETYWNNIESYINGGGMYPFSAENYVATIMKECFNIIIK